MRKKYNFTREWFGQKRKKPVFKRPVFGKKRREYEKNQAASFKIR